MPLAISHTRFIHAVSILLGTGEPLEVQEERLIGLVSLVSVSLAA